MSFKVFWDIILELNSMKLVMNLFLESVIILFRGGKYGVVLFSVYYFIYCYNCNFNNYY